MSLLTAMLDDAQLTNKKHFVLQQQSGKQTEEKMHFQQRMGQLLGDTLGDTTTSDSSPVVSQLVTLSIRQVHVLSMHGASRVSGGTGCLPK